ncbi:MAG: response regulator transcription factor [Aliidongia sp.]
MRKILVVDDDVDLAQLLEDYLVPEGFAVEQLHDGAVAAATSPDAFDLVILDVMLPHRSGFEVLREFRRRSETPVILLTARDNDTDRVVGLELGADDYVPKPFNPRELVARIRAVLRRTQRSELPAPALQVGDVVLDPRARAASRAGLPLDLTSAEFDLMERLLQHAGRPVGRDELAQAALGRAGYAGLDRNVDTLVSKLRRKLGRDDLIKTVRNVGYLYATPRQPSG